MEGAAGPGAGALSSTGRSWAPGIGRTHSDSHWSESGSFRRRPPAGGCPRASSSSSSPASQQQQQPSSTGDWLLGSVLGRLWELSLRKLKEFADRPSGPEHACLSLDDWFSESRQPAFHSLLSTLRSAVTPPLLHVQSSVPTLSASLPVGPPLSSAVNSCSAAAAAVVTWRCSQMVSSAKWAATTSPLSVQLGVEYVSAAALVVVLEGAAHDVLSEPVFARVLESAVTFFSAPLAAGATAAQDIANRRQVCLLWGNVLCSVATFNRLPKVAEALCMAIEHAAGRSGAAFSPGASPTGSPTGPVAAVLPSVGASHEVVFSLLTAVKCLKPRPLVGSNGSLYARQLLETFYGCVQRVHSLSRIDKVMSGALLDTLATLLAKADLGSPGMADQSPEFDPSTPRRGEWEDLVQRVWEWVKRLSKPHRSSALQTVLLCCSGREFFLRNWWVGFLEPLLKAKDRASRSMAMDAAPLLMNAYLTRYRDTHEASHETVVSICSMAFFPQGGRRLLQSSQDPLDRFVDLTCCVARSKVDYAVQTVIFDLLRIPSESEPFFPERATVGVLSCATIIHVTKGSELDSLLSLSAIPTLETSVPWQAWSVRLLSECWERLLGHAELYTEGLIAAISKLLQYLARPRQINANDSERWLELSKCVLCVLPLLYVDHLVPEDVVAVVTGHVTHSDRGIREVVSTTLAQLMATCPDLAVRCIHKLIDDGVALAADDKKRAETTCILNQLLHTLGVLRRILEGPAVPQMHYEVPILHLTQLEGLSMIFLCSPVSRHRLLALHLIDAVRDIGQHFPGDSSVRVADVVSRRGSAIVSSLPTLYERFNIPSTCPAVYPLKSAQALAASELERDVRAWTYFLAELVKDAAVDVPASSSFAYHAVVPEKIVVVQPAVPSANSESNLANDPSTLWWRNLIAMACASSSTSKTGVSPLVNLVLPYLQISFERDDLTLGDVAIVAIERIAPSCYPELFGVLEAIRAEIVSASPTKVRKDRAERIRNTLGIVYAYIAEHMPSGTVANDPRLASVFCSFVSDEIRWYLSSSAVASLEFVWDNMLFARYNLCVVVKKIADEMSVSGGTSLLPEQLRRDALHLFMVWTSSEKQFREPPARKKVAAELFSLIREQKKREILENTLVDHTLFLQYAAGSAVSALRPAPHDNEQSIFQWVDELLSRDTTPSRKERLKPRRARRLLRRCAVDSIKSLLVSSPQNAALLLTVIDNCYSPLATLSKGYFTALVEFLSDASNSDAIIQESKVLACCIHLVLFMAGDVRHTVRQRARLLLDVVNGLAARRKTHVPFGVFSSLAATTALSQLSLSQSLARQFPHECYRLVGELALRSKQVASPCVRQLLAFVVPWVEKFDLSRPHPSKLIALQNLMFLTHEHASELPQLVGALWTALAVKPYNVFPAISAMLDVATQGPGYLVLLKIACVHIVTKAPRAVADCLIGELVSQDIEEPYPLSDASSVLTEDETCSVPADSTLSSQVPGVTTSSNPLSPSASASLRPPQATTNSLRRRSADYARVITPVRRSSSPKKASLLDSVLPVAESATSLSRSHIAVAVLSEITYLLTAEDIRSHLPAMLHVVFLGFDFPSLTVYDNCRLLLLNTVRGMVLRRFREIDLNPADSKEYERALRLCTFLESKEGEQLWPVYNPMELAPESSEMQAVRELVCEVAEVIGIDNAVIVAASSTDISFRARWAAEAYTWAIGCDQVQQAARSCQIFSALGSSSFRPQEALGLLQRLVSVLREQEASIQHCNYAGALLLAFENCIGSLTVDDLAGFPAVWWACASLLTTDCERHYVTSLRTLGRLVDILPENKNNDGCEEGCCSESPIVLALKQTVPAEWKDFTGIIPLVVRGIVCRDTLMYCVRVVSRIFIIPFDQEQELSVLCSLVILIIWTCCCTCDCDDWKEVAETFSRQSKRSSRPRHLSDVVAVFGRFAEGSIAQERFREAAEGPFAKYVLATKQTEEALRLLLGIAEQSPIPQYTTSAIRLAWAILQSVPREFLSWLKSSSVSVPLFCPLLRLLSDERRLPCGDASWMADVRKIISWVMQHASVTPNCSAADDFDDSLSASATSGTSLVSRLLPLPSAGSQTPVLLRHAVDSWCTRSASAKADQGGGNAVSAPSNKQFDRLFSPVVGSSALDIDGVPATASKPAHTPSVDSSFEDPSSDPPSSSVPAVAPPQSPAVQLRFPTFKGFEEMLLGMEVAAAKKNKPQYPRLRP